MEKYLKPTKYLDFENDAIRKAAAAAGRGETDPVTLAVNLFDFVRDSISYNPYINWLDPEIYISSRILKSESNFCIPKAVLYASLARAAGIPSRLRFATIRNYLLPDNLKRFFDDNIIYGHGFAEVYLNGKWLIATPTFDNRISRNYGFRLVEFDGNSDARLPSSDEKGNAHIEYIDYSESFDDLPYEHLYGHMKEKYRDFDAIGTALKDYTKDGI